jgi:hypothetical protein
MARIDQLGLVNPDDLSTAWHALESVQHRFLKAYGWEYTCNTPGAIWLWRRDFADIDAGRWAWDEAHRAGEAGRPSLSRPYGVITAPVDIAITMTLAVLVDTESNEVQHG